MFNMTLCVVNNLAQENVSWMINSTSQLFIITAWVADIRDLIPQVFSVM